MTFNEKTQKAKELMQNNCGQFDPLATLQDQRNNTDLGNTARATTRQEQEDHSTESHKLSMYLIKQENTFSKTYLRNYLEQVEYHN